MMRHPVHLFAFCCLVSPVLAQDGGASPIDYDFARVQRVLHQAIDKVAPATVTVQTFGGTRKVAGKRPAAKPGEKPKNPFRPGRPGGRPKPLGMQGFLQAQGATTGVIISEDGWILVSKFALNFDPTTILITLADGRSFNAVRKGEDISRQIALVKIEAEDLPVAEFVSPKLVTVGQWAFALGRTFGPKDPSVHMGVVSAKDRIFGRAVQIDAYTSPANYGGPVIDIQGRVIGISVPMDASGRKANVGLYDSGIGFAATIADIPELIEQMKKGEILHRGYHGLAPSPADLGPGAKVRSIRKDSPCHSAKIRKGHTILEVDGVAVKNGFHLQMLLNRKMAGEAVHLKYRQRDGKEFGKTVFLTKVPGAEMEAKEQERLPPPWEEEGEKKSGGER